MNRECVIAIIVVTACVEIYYDQLFIIITRVLTCLQFKP